MCWRLLDACGLSVWMSVPRGDTSNADGCCATGLCSFAFNALLRPKVALELPWWMLCRATLELPWMLWWATSGGHPGPKLPIVYWPAGRPLLHLREPSDDLDHTAVLALAKPPLVTTMKFDTISDQVWISGGGPDTLTMQSFWPQKRISNHVQILEWQIISVNSD